MKIAIVNFNSGLVTQKIDPRSDTEKYGAGCRILQNMIPSIFGGAEKRTGTEFISTKSAFDVILTSLVAWQNIVVCWGNTPVVTDFDSTLSQLTCWENDVMCYENEIVADVTMAFLSRAICYENNIVFWENETTYI